MTRRLRLLLIAQIALFGAWGARLATSYANAPSVWLATEPVDPRDLIAGHYVALRYRIGSATIAGCGVPVDAAGPVIVWVRLEDRGDRRWTDAGPVPVAEPVACRTTPPEPAPGERWITGRLAPHGDRIAYGIERFYVGETSRLREATTGHVVARVALGDDRRARIVALVPTRPAPGP